MKGEWIRRPANGTIVIFVHGILSSADTCWSNPAGGSWPVLLEEEAQLKSVGIYSFTYQTDVFSGSYRLGDAVDALKEHMRLDGADNSKRLIFVCHSMGGIVVRKYLVERQAELISGQKEIGLFLVASPSLGSSYADWLAPLAAFMGHAQASALRFVRGNDWLMDLDKEFTNLKEANALSIRGKELIEDKFVLIPKLWRRQVVEPFSGARYFGEPYKVPKSDHFSISKPLDRNAIQHRLLVQFVQGFLDDLVPVASPVAPPRAPRRISLSHLPISGKFCVGREAELEELGAAWSGNRRATVISIVAWGGVGKSALVNHWLGRLSEDGFDGAATVFGWSFYTQGTSTASASGDAFLDNALRHFGVPQIAAESPREKAVRLAEAVRAERSLLILDGLEPLQFPPGPNAGKLKDVGVATLVRELAVHNPGLCVITTRTPIADLAHYETTARRLDLRPLTAAAGATLLRSLGVGGDERELQLTSAEFSGHSLALTLLAHYLTEVWNGDITKRRDVSLFDEDVDHGGHAERVLRSYEVWFDSNGRKVENSLLFIIGLFDRPADLEAMASLRRQPVIEGLTDEIVALTPEQWTRLTTRLCSSGLLTQHSDGALDAHPLVREYFSRRLASTDAEVWRRGHNRLFEHLTKASPLLPDTVEGVMPLYAALQHGCAAGRYETALMQVYSKRIQRGSAFFAAKTLGTVGADVAGLEGFFERAWDSPVRGLSAKATSMLLDDAGEALHAVGRLSEALAAMQALLAWGRSRDDLKDMTKSAITLSELSLTMGNIEQAIRYGTDCVSYAGRRATPFHMQVSRSTLADALHQAGRFNEASEVFREAESIESSRRPSAPILTSMQGYAYCDLLLTIGAVDEVHERGRRMLEFANTDKALLAAALSRLAIGRALMATGMESERILTAREHIHASVAGLRHAGAEFQLPRALLAAAECERARGDLNTARRYAGEALTLASRSGMKLREIDSYLELVKIEVAENNSASAAISLQAARSLIALCGYGRRAESVHELDALIEGIR